MRRSARNRLSILALLLITLIGPGEAAAQRRVDRFASGTPADGIALPTSSAADQKTILGAISGGLIGGAITAGCLALHGMAAPEALPYCAIPTVLGVVFGAWSGANTRNDPDALETGRMP